MKKIFYLFRETFYMIKKYKIFFLAPLFILLILLALVAFYIGPSVVISFFYAGV